MVVIRSKIEDNTHIYNIAAGTNREGLLVYLTTTANTVSLAISTVLSTARVAGVITRDYGSQVEVSTSGDVFGIKETALLIDPGDVLFLSELELGKITKIPPTITGRVISNLGKASNINGDRVQFNMQLISTIEL